jgi:hypothetical protein
MDDFHTSAFSHRSSRIPPPPPCGEGGRTSGWLEGLFREEHLEGCDQFRQDSVMRVEKVIRRLSFSGGQPLAV